MKFKFCKIYQLSNHFLGRVKFSNFSNSNSRLFDIFLRSSTSKDRASQKCEAFFILRVNGREVHPERSATESSPRY